MELHLVFMFEQRWVAQMDPLTVLIISILRVDLLEIHWNISARVIRRIAVTAVTAAARSGLTWLGVHVMAVG